VAAAAVGIPLDAAGARFGRAAALALYRDGGRLPAAVDVYLPPGASGRLPAILIFTPYYRRFALRARAPPESEASPGVARWRDLFVPRGCALVAVDVRGTGASFRRFGGGSVDVGCCAGFRTPAVTSPPHARAAGV
jgi:hypothetical protein